MPAFFPKTPFLVHSGTLRYIASSASRPTPLSWPDLTLPRATEVVTALTPPRATEVVTALTPQSN